MCAEAFKPSMTSSISFRWTASVTLNFLFSAKLERVTRVRPSVLLDAMASRTSCDKRSDDDDDGDDREEKTNPAAADAADAGGDDDDEECREDADNMLQFVVEASTIAGIDSGSNEGDAAAAVADAPFKDAAAATEESNDDEDAGPASFRASRNLFFPFSSLSK
jgi:hypothetical protein